MGKDGAASSPREAPTCPVTLSKDSSKQLRGKGVEGLGRKGRLRQKPKHLPAASGTAEDPSPTLGASAEAPILPAQQALPGGRQTWGQQCMVVYSEK